MDLRQFLGILRDRWRFIVVTLFIGTLITVGITLATPTQYASRATLWVTTPNTGALDPYSASASAKDRAQSYANLANNPELLQQAAARLQGGLSAAELGRRVRTTLSTDTLLLQVDAHAGSPEYAQQIATVVSDEIIRMVKEIESPADSSIPAPIVARLVAKATLNPRPVSPNIPLNIVTGLGLSLLAGMAGAILRSTLDTSVKDFDDVAEITGLDPLAALPFDSSVSDDPLSSESSGGAMSEAFRVLRTNLRFANLDKTRQTIVVTSSVPDEGKTFVATNLAISMAKSGQRVLLIDGDLRHPNVARLLGLENSVGLVNVLVGRTSIEQSLQAHRSGVTFLATGPQPPNPAEVLDTKVMRELLRQLSAAFDVVLIDAPPLLPVADATILLTEVDGALLLVRHGATHREHLRQAVARVQAVGGKVFGTVINRVPLGAKTGTYSYYGYGYGYGDPFDEPDAKRAATTRGRARR